MNGEVVIVSDVPGGRPDLVGFAGQSHDVVVIGIEDFAAGDYQSGPLFVFDADLQDRKSVVGIRDGCSKGQAVDAPRLFVLPSMNRRQVIQAHNLAATDFTARPLDADGLWATMDTLINGSVERGWEELNDVQKAALKVSLKVFEDTFLNAQKGAPLPQDDIKRSCSLIVKATAGDGLEEWMAQIKSHHNYTYRHSMMVCGFLVSFAHAIGIRNDDLELLAVSGVVHDVGKARVPLDVLDKPAKLTDSEWEIIKAHPLHSIDILDPKLGWAAEIVDAAAHHHEKLDGTGYPDGLKGGEISDLARMVAIADVYSALTDKRTYKPAMTAEAALEIMLSMDGHLDMALVKAFQQMMLDTNARPAAL